MRRMILTLALLSVPVFGFTSCGDCYPVFLNGPDNHPPGAVYIADTQSWWTTVAGRPHLYGYSLTYDTVIMNRRDCIYNLAEEPEWNVPAARFN